MSRRVGKASNGQDIPVLSSAAAGRPPPRTARRWAQFLGGLLVILLFAFGAIPALQRLGPIREVREVIRRSGIDATALFYTESDVSSEAEASILNAIRYSPCSYRKKE